MTTKPMDLADMLKAGTLPDDLLDPDLLQPLNNVVPIKGRAQRTKPEPDDDDGPAFDFERGDHVELAETLVADLGPPNEVVFTEGKFWRYSEEIGRWLELDQPDVDRRIMEYAGRQVLAANRKVKPLKVNAKDLTGVSAVARSKLARERFFSAHGGSVSFTNGVVCVASQDVELRPAGPELQARTGFDFAYDPDAKPERFLAFLADIFEPDTDRAERVEFVQEFFGCCLLGIATKAAVSFVAVGVGSNGKSALASIMQSCMPDGSVSALAPQDMKDDYKRAQLVGKHLNVVAEMPERDILESSSVKAVIDGSYLGARQIYSAPFYFHPMAGHYFAANALPATADQSKGFWRRFLPLQFNREFSAQHADTGLADDIVAAERPAIVSWLVAGAARYLRAGYTIPASSDITKATWKLDSNQVARFLHEMVTVLEPDSFEAKAGHGIRAMPLYKNYRTWANDNGHKNPLAANTFGARVQQLGHKPKHTKWGALYLLQMKDGSCDAE